MLSIGGLSKNTYSRLFSLGIIIWSIVALVVVSFDRVQLGVATIVLMNNFWLYHNVKNRYTLNSIEQLKLLNAMMVGGLILIIVIFIKFGHSIFIDYKFQLLIFLIELIIYCICIKLLENRSRSSLEINSSDECNN